MQVMEVAKAGLTGWQRRAAEAIADPVAQRTGLSRDQLLAILGALSLALVTWRYLVTMKRAFDAGREQILPAAD